MRKALNITALLGSVAMFASQLPVGYEYWLDGDHLSAVLTEASGNVEFDVDAKHLEPGGHYISYRFLDNNGHWGAPLTQPFYVPFNVPKTGTPTAYEYWLDGDRLSAVLTEASGNVEFDVDVNALAPGGHYISYRFLDDNGHWGAPLTQPFYVPLEVSTNIASYRQYINNHLVNETTLPSEQTELDITLAIDDDTEIMNVTNREFSYANGLVIMNIDGSFLYALQMKSKYEGWGTPLIGTFDKEASFTQAPVEINCPGDYKFSKVSNNRFIAVKFNTYGESIYIGTSQACIMQIYQLNETGEWEYISTYTAEQLTKTALFDKTTGADDTFLALLYEMPTDAANQDDEIILRLMLENNRLPEPTIYFDETTKELDITCKDKEASIYYTTDGTDPTKADSLVFDNPIILEHNVTIKAMAAREGIGESFITTRIIDSFTVPKPELVKVEGGYVFTNSLEGVTTWYTLDGSSPTHEDKRIRFDGQPFAIDSKCVIYAYSTKQDFNDSEIVRFDFTPQSDKPICIGYNGRHVSIGINPEDKVLYSINGDDPLTNGIELDSGGASQLDIDIEGLHTLRAVCLHDDANPSEEMTFTPEYYANETTLYTTAPHQASNAFGWTEDKSVIERLAVHGTLNDGTVDDATDYNWITENLTNLKHIDLRDVIDKIVPTNALASDNLITAVMPAAMTTVGENIFGTDNKTLCAIELPAQNIAPAGLLKGVSNPNLLGYVAEKRYATTLRKELRNVIYGESLTADTIKLSHGNPFYVPMKFTAGTITYSREFTKETAIGDFGSGWETVCVPFDVKTVRNGDILLEPFALENRQGKPFWLYEGDGTGWKRCTEIQANMPYLIAMPNNPWYEKEYNVAGTITFSAANAMVDESTAGDIAAGFGGGNIIHTNYAMIPNSEDVLALNESDVLWNSITYRPGGIFAKGLRNVLPFECYVTSGSGAQYVKLFDDSGINGIEDELGFRVWTENHVLCLRSDMDMNVPIYDTVGQMIRIIKVKANEVCRISDITSGIYIVADKKIMI